MQARQLGTSELHITPVGLGAWAIGGSWGPQDDSDSIAAINKALDLGVNWIDTAAAYGRGHSEEVVAKALKGRSEQPYVFTKCSLVWEGDSEIGHSLKADSIRREAEASLKRLQRETIDLYQIHWPDPDPDIEEGWTTLAELRKEGKVRNIGVSNFSVEQMRRAMVIAPITSLQPPYSLLRREVEAEILPFCHSNDIGVIVYSPMGSGMLTGRMTRERIEALPDDDWRKNSPQFQEPELSRNLELAEKLKAIGEKHGNTPAEVAIAWTLRNPAVTGAIVGMRRPDQVEGVIGASDLRLTDDEVAQLEA